MEIIETIKTNECVDHVIIKVAESTNADYYECLICKKIFIEQGNE